MAENLVQRACVGDMATRTAARFPDRAAVVDGERVFTYSELNNAANQVARSLLSSGLGHGDVVAVISRNTWAMPVTYLAAAKAGLVFLPLNAALTSAEMSYILSDSEARTLVAESPFEDKAVALLADVGGLDSAYIVEPSSGGPAATAGGGKPVLDFEELMTGSTEEVEVRIEDRDTLQLMYTSGTTSNPKGVEISHLAALFSGLCAALELKLVYTDVNVAIMPLFHVGQLNCMWVSHMLVGACSVMVRSYDPVEVMSTIEAKQATTTLMTAPMWTGLLDLPEAEERDFSSMRLCVIGAATLAPERVEQLTRIFANAEARLMSGQTEFTPPNEIQRPEHARTKTTSWGPPTTTMGVQVMDNDGQLLAPGEVGELVYRGPQAMTRYYKEPEATAEAFRHGWFHTGDLGWIDEENVVWFVDRKKDIIKTGGENVATIEVELSIAGLPGVAECATVGLPHPRWTEAVTAFVRLAPGQQVSEEEMIRLCRERLAAFKVPKRIIFMDELPRSSSGKIQKFELRTAYSDLYTGHDRDHASA